MYLYSADHFFLLDENRLVRVIRRIVKSSSHIVSDILRNAYRVERTVVCTLEEEKHAASP